MKIAIVGAGLAGVATAWHLLHINPHIQIVLFDPKGIAGGASAVPLALLHCYSGAKARLSFRAQEGWHATWHLIGEAEKALQRPIAKMSGVLRAAMTRQQHQDFAAAAASYGDLLWLEEAGCQNRCPGIAAKAGIWIEQAAVVDTKAYLMGLWHRCLALGARLEPVGIDNLEALADFDKVVVAAGADSSTLLQCRHLAITPIKGQMLHLKCPTPLPACPIASHLLLLPHSEQNSVLVGSTYERHYLNGVADTATAENLLLPKAIALFPALADAQVVDVYAGIRASAPLHRPIVEPLAENHWIFTGLGSKGMLWHALLAQELAEQLIN